MKNRKSKKLNRNITQFVKNQMKLEATEKKMGRVKYIDFLKSLRDTGREYFKLQKHQEKKMYKLTPELKKKWRKFIHNERLRLLKLEKELG